ncbi:MAG: methionyl-tRNA formyltransferase [Balneolaceae bacterium]|nr:MAG: methionyl-tRNA formyltransferase [Balneolaceae bacterium]
MGSPDFAVPSLENIYNSMHTVQAVVSNPDKRRGRRGKPEPTAVKNRALELNLPVIDVDDVKSAEFRDQLSALKPDLLVVVAFRILPPSILEIPKIGSVNLHASLLPKYRGAAPIHWAIINGEEKTGCTVFFLNEKVDTGNIVDTVETAIGPLENTGDLYNRLKDIGSKLLIRCIDKIAGGNYSLKEQDNSQATPAPKLFKENTKINFNQDADAVHNFIRGLNPFPGAWCMYDDQKMNIYRTKPVRSLNIEPGTLRYSDKQLLAGCRKGSVELLDVQLPGTKVMSGAEFANGYNLNSKLE